MEKTWLQNWLASLTWCQDQWAAAADSCDAVGRFCRASSNGTESNSLLNLAISELNLSTRSRNVLERANVVLIRDLVSRTASQLADERNAGPIVISEVRERLGAFG